MQPPTYIGWLSLYYEGAHILNILFLPMEIKYETLFLWGVHILKKLLCLSDGELQLILILPYPQMTQYQKKVVFFFFLKKNCLHSRNKSWKCFLSVMLNPKVASRNTALRPVWFRTQACYEASGDPRMKNQ